MAARKMGWDTVPTIKLGHLTESQRMAFLIADNRLTETGGAWDERMLGEQLKILSELELDFDLETIGFEVPEIDLLIDGLNAVPKADPDDRLPEMLDSAATVSGDMWQLGKHRVLCGNSLVTESYEQLMQTAKADLVISDAPYNVRIDGHATGNGSIRHREFAMASGEMSSVEFTDFLRKAMIAARDHSTAGSLAYYFMDWRHMREILSAGREVYSDLVNLCVWAKSNGGMGSFYRSAHELIFLFKNGTGSHRNNVQLGKFGRNRTNVWNYPGANTFSRSDEGNLLALHPTPKPVAMIADAIKDCTARGDLILDPFLGSGTAVIAAERSGRRWYGLELDPLYVDTIIRRWQRQTKLDAIHMETGETFKGRDGERDR
jgi:DNA modification methylase